MEQIVVDRLVRARDYWPDVYAVPDHASGRRGYPQSC